MEIRLNPQLAPLALKNKISSMYAHLFSYDLDELTMYSDEDQEILNKLSYAFLHREYILLTFNDGKQEIVKIKNLLDAGQKVVAITQDNIYQIINETEIFKIEFADQFMN